MDFDALLARTGIAAGQVINEIEFYRQIHNRHLTPDEIAFLRNGLRARGLWEDRV